MKVVQWTTFIVLEVPERIPIGVGLRRRLNRGWQVREEVEAGLLLDEIAPQGLDRSLGVIRPADIKLYDLVSVTPTDVLHLYHECPGTVLKGLYLWPAIRLISTTSVLAASKVIKT